MKLVQRYLVLLLVGASLMLYMAAHWLGVHGEIAVLLSSLATLFVVWLLERRHPYRNAWNQRDGDLPTDLVSAAVIAALVDPLLKVVMPIAVVWIYGTLEHKSGLSALPFFVEVVAVVLVAEFGKYWSHRIHHRLAPLWWLHAMHHSSERLYVLNGLRFHPINHAVNSTASLLPVMLVGASPEAVLAYLALTQPIVLAQHANVQLEHGWLNWVLSTPESHRWHHSTEPQEAHRNFGNALLLWDHVFGTFKPAQGFDEARRVGLFEQSRRTYPGRKPYFTQLASMFRAPCCRA